MAQVPISAISAFSAVKLVWLLFLRSRLGSGRKIWGRKIPAPAGCDEKATKQSTLKTAGPEARGQTTEGGRRTEIRCSAFGNETSPLAHARSHGVHYQRIFTSDCATAARKASALPTASST